MKGTYKSRRKSRHGQPSRGGAVNPFRDGSGAHWVECMGICNTMPPPSRLLSGFELPRVPGAGRVAAMRPGKRSVAMESWSAVGRRLDRLGKTEYANRADAEICELSEPSDTGVSVDGG